MTVTTLLTIDPLQATTHLAYNYSHILGLLLHWPIYCLTSLMHGAMIKITHEAINYLHALSYTLELFSLTCVPKPWLYFIIYQLRSSKCYSNVIKPIQSLYKKTHYLYSHESTLLQPGCCMYPYSLRVELIPFIIKLQYATYLSIQVSS